MFLLLQICSLQSTVLSHCKRALTTSLHIFQHGRNTRKNVRAGHSFDSAGGRRCFASPLCQKDQERDPCMGRLYDSFGTGKSGPTSESSSVLLLTDLDPVIHNWYRIVHVCGLVFDLKVSVDSGLIRTSRNRTRGSRTTHKDRTGWLTHVHPSLRGLPTGKIFLQSSTL